MKIKDLFQKDIKRKIEEVIKVDQSDKAVVNNELEEYVVTNSLKKHYINVLEAYNEGRTNPTEGIGIWISGFFGSGKSSFAKNLGYILSDRKLFGRAASDIFALRSNDDRITDFLKVINKNIPTKAIIFDISMDRGFRMGGEFLTEVMYRVLLRELGYAEDFDLARLEMDLEEDNLLQKFEELYVERYKRSWRVGRKRGSALNEASAIRHEMDPSTYPQSDSWIKSLSVSNNRDRYRGRANIWANKLAEESFKLSNRRCPGRALLFVIDEVGQYISRSVDRMLDLQGIVQAFGKMGRNLAIESKIIAPAWIVVTSQEKLSEVVDALDSKRIELARLQDRFPIRIDLAPADIVEVTSKRVLQKKPDVEERIGEIFDKNHGRLKTFCKLERTSRDSIITRKSFIDLYPYLPYYIDLSIDIMSGIRLQPGALRHIGGSNRTVIKQAQQMLINEQTNLGEEEIGIIVTIDKIYSLVESNISSEKRKDISDITTRLRDPWCSKVAKAICLLEFVRDLPRSQENIAALLFNSVEAESCLEEVKEALKTLENHEFIQQTRDGFKLLSAEAKNWEITRRGLSPRPKDRNKITREVLEEIFSDYRIKTYRYKNLKNFKISININGEKIGGEGEVPISLIIIEDIKDQKEKIKETRLLSKENNYEIYWIFLLNENIHSGIKELYRSREMVITREHIAAQGKLTTDELSCLSEEKVRKDQLHRELKSKFVNALQIGTGFFKGVEKDVSSLGNTLPEVVKRLLDYAVPDLYPKLEMGTGYLTGKEAENILLAANLAGLSSVFYEGKGGLNLVIKQDNKYIVNLSADIVKEIIDYIRQQHSYGEKITGKVLEIHFGGIGYGWDTDVLRMVLATLFRAGVLEVVFQGKRFKDFSEPSAREPFIKNIVFRSASFAPREAPSLKLLTNAAKNYEEITGQEISIEENIIARVFKQIATNERNLIRQIKATTCALDLPGKKFLEEFDSYLKNIEKASSDDCVKMLAIEGKNFKENKKRVKGLYEATRGSSMKTLKFAKIAVDKKIPVLRRILSDDNEIIILSEKLEQNLKADSYYERMSDIANAEGRISLAFSEIYKRVHEERTRAYSQIIDEIKGSLGWATIPEEIKKSILSPFINSICKKLDFETKDITCKNCSTVYRDIELGIMNLDNLKRKAFKKIIKITSPESSKIEYVKISSFFTRTIQSEEDLRDGIKQFMNYIQKSLAEGKTIILE